MEKRLIDANALKKDCNLNFGGVSHAAAAAEIIDRQPTVDRESRFMTVGKRADYLEKLYTKIQAVTRLTPERLLELFIEGYTLQAPDLRKELEEMQRIAWMDLPGQNGGQDR